MSLLSVLLRDALSLLRLLSSRVGFLTKSLRLLAPLLELPLTIPHRCESHQRENEHHADRDHDPDPSCHCFVASCVQLGANGARRGSLPLRNHSSRANARAMMEGWGASFGA